MNILFNRPSTPEAAAIRERIFNVLPSATYQMEKLFGLFDIEFSDETETACVECRTTPRLLLNKGFLDEYCRDDGDLFLLILHELYHVILGHTRLFPRVTPIDNIVFDAVINSMLCRTVGRTVGTRLFTRINGFDSLPERLLNLNFRCCRCVLIAILTDGAENSSRSFSVADILQMITYRRKTYDWRSGLCRAYECLWVNLEGTQVVIDDGVELLLLGCQPYVQGPEVHR